VASTAFPTSREDVRTAAVAHPSRVLGAHEERRGVDGEATVRASLVRLDSREREQLGQWLYRQAERRGLVLRLGFDELSGAARLGEIAVLTSMVGAIHRVSPTLLGELLAAGDEHGHPCPPVDVLS
jgi:hypothetical protein